MDKWLKSIVDLGDTQFGLEAIYKNRKSRYKITGIFDEPYQGVDVAEVEFASATPMFTIPTAALPCRPEYGDLLLIDCEEYKVRNFKADGTGVTVLQLEFLTKYEEAVVNNILLENGANLLTEAGAYLIQETGNI
jgi:hypothetical protein